MPTLTSQDDAVAKAAALIGLTDDGDGFDSLEDGQLVVKPPSQVVYIARRRDLVLVLKQRFPIFENGIKVGETQGLRAKFRNSQLRLDRDNEAHAELFELLEKHPLNGNAFNGFIRGVEPAPTATAAEMQNLVDAAIGLDVETIEEFIRQEEKGYAREDVLSTARMSLKRVQTVLQAQEARVERPAEEPAAEEPAGQQGAQEPVAEAPVEPAQPPAEETPPA